MTGLDFLERQFARGCKLPIKKIRIVTGSWTNEQQHKAEQLGCEVFEKPFLPGRGKWLQKLETGVQG